MWQKIDSFRRYWSNQNIPKSFLFWYAVGQILAFSGIGQYIPFTATHYRLFLTKSPVAMVLFGNPKYVRDEEEVLEKIVVAGDVVLDVGANIGTFSLRAAKLSGETGQVFAFEGNPKTARVIERNARLNNLSNIQVTAAAVGDKNGTVNFSVGAGDDVDHVTNSRSGISVPILRLDDFAPLQAVSNIRIINIDVEGYELFTLQGGEKTILKSERVIFEAYEANCRRAGYELDELFNWFLERGFRLANLDGGPLNLLTAGRLEVKNVLATRS
jgi:FkbM family methyltransferase